MLSTMLRDRRKSLTLEHQKSPALERLKSERRGSFAAPSSGPVPPPPASAAASNSLHPSSAEHSSSPVDKQERRGSIVSRWFRHISDAAEAYKAREGRHRRQDERAQEDLNSSTQHDKTKESEDSSGGEMVSSPPRNNGQTTDEATSDSSLLNTPESRNTEESVSPVVGRVSEPLRQTTAESPLIEPSEVLVCQSPILTAEPVLTPLEKLRRTDEVIRQALEEKKRLVADILHVPRDDFDTIAELAAEPSRDKEATEIVLAAVNQATKLWSVVNEAMRVTEEEAVCASVDSTRSRYLGVPAHQLQHISSTLNSQLSLLLNVMTVREEERERLRQEVQRSREQLHSLYERNVEVGGSGLSAGTELLAEPVGAASLLPTTPEVFVDALSGEAESQ